MLTTETAKASAASLDEMASSDRATVAVIIPTFNHAHFLADAIASVLAQTRQADEIIVIDDGSADDPATVTAKFPKVRLIRQDNKGLSAARNTGIQSCSSKYIVFLDADDRLLPAALQAGLDCIASRPDCAFVRGGYRLISEDSPPVDILRPIDGNPHLAFIRSNIIGPPMSVLFRRDCLLALNGFDEALTHCEDYDIYLRMAQKYTIASHREIVSEYRRHDGNMSKNYVAMLKGVLRVLKLHEARIALDPPTRAALQEGRAYCRRFYVSRMLDAASTRWRSQHSIRIFAKDFLQSVRWSPLYTIRRLVGVLGRRIIKTLPPQFGNSIQRMRGRPYHIPLGSVRFGDLKRLSPIGHTFGIDRGTAVDRHYIENFLSQNADDIRGRVLEIGDNAYTLRFGKDRVVQSDILHVDSSNSRATFVGDLARPDVLPEETFDCIVLTQTLHFIYDIPAAVGTLFRSLKPGGVLLMTTPGIGQVDWGEWDAICYWLLTEAATRRLLEGQFGPNSVTAKSQGNVFAATAFLYGLAVEELSVSDLDAYDKHYPVIITARAMKRKDA